MLFNLNATLHIATADDASRLFGDLLPWLLLLIAFVIVGGIVLYMIRRTINEPDSEQVEPFTLQGLRQMRAQGQITDEEFERARAAMISRIKGEPDAASQNETGDATSGEDGSDALSDDAPGGSGNGAAPP